MDQGLPAAGLCAARRLNPCILTATQFGTPVIMPGDDAQEDHAENDFLETLPPLSFDHIGGVYGTFDTARHRAMWLRGHRIGEAACLSWNL